MLLPFDHQLYRFFQNGISSWEIAGCTLPILLVLAFLLWAWLERRSRSRWLRSSTQDTFHSEEGPYRASKHSAMLTRAPRIVLLSSWLGVLLGVFGVVWPILFVTDLSAGTTASFALLLEALGAFAAVVSLLGAIRLLRRTDGFSTREAIVMRVVAVLYGALGLLYLLGMFDQVDVTAYAIKWRDVVTVHDLVRSGFAYVVGGHCGVAWRLLLRTSAIFGLLCAVHFTLWSFVVHKRIAKAEEAVA
jgi:hypothetical protein